MKYFPLLTLDSLVEYQLSQQLEQQHNKYPEFDHLLRMMIQSDIAIHAKNQLSTKPIKEDSADAAFGDGC